MAIDYTKLLDGNSLKAIKSYIDNNFVKSNSSITGSTKCKITYDSKGLVTAGANLAANDIPSLPASKITSGTFADARIASASTWNSKTKITLNGKAVTSTSIYAPTTSGTAGQYCLRPKDRVFGHSGPAGLWGGHRLPARQKRRLLHCLPEF